ncbi:DUF1120 domain-containing protein [Burkholderia dolosa]|uniref:DUF1120 domain-containing protein n=1 Tax=Burkholderia dolosa TaxID=152500 RepID=A0A892I5X5_9BURK|nr:MULTISPECIES: DUF1120 domain-containing protein [Burkholderia]AKE05353.1 hypothetical protein XM57_22040 [Burkholderia cepacia]AJY09725.1 hypothetical protein AK34_4675 [Burkholderia dolosa AU0158]AYZ94331.1 DUF1120 domain-containing protein [Burkholderia dolosa]EAY71570.1 hypothetical protein BDAG_04408 [Burkholderia dolosa AU0158]ETP63619.1 Molecular chaperone [Burkholderia dolosa PC543]
MRKAISALAAAGALSAAPPVHAQSADLSVKGSITPAACAIQLGNNGEVDHGDIPSSTLSPGEPTALPAQHVPLAISCDGATRFAIAFADNRSGTAWGAGPTVFGLGETDGSRIGGYRLQFDPRSFTGDGATIESYQQSIDNGETWLSGDTLPVQPDTWVGFSDSANNSGPAAFRQVTGPLRVSTVIAPADELPATDEVPLDGSATLELKYL